MSAEEEKGRKEGRKEGEEEEEVKKIKEEQEVEVEDRRRRRRRRQMKKANVLLLSPMPIKLCIYLTREGAVCEIMCVTKVQGVGRKDGQSQTDARIKTSI